MLAEGRGMGWKPLLVPYWVVVGSWSWGPGGGPGVVHYCQMRSIFLLVVSLRSWVLRVLFLRVFGVFSWVSPFARSVLRASAASLSLPPGACGAPSLSRGPGWGPRAPLVQVPYRASP